MHFFISMQDTVCGFVIFAQYLRKFFFPTTYFKLLADSLIRSSTRWWENPSMLVPLIVTITSPVIGYTKERINQLHNGFAFYVCISVCLRSWLGGPCLHAWAVIDLSIYVYQKGNMRSVSVFESLCGACREDVGGSPVVRPAFSAALSSSTLHTNVHISTAQLFLSCRP